MSTVNGVILVLYCMQPYLMWNLPTSLNLIAPESVIDFVMAPQWFNLPTLPAEIPACGVHNENCPSNGRTCFTNSTMQICTNTGCFSIAVKKIVAIVFSCIALLIISCLLRQHLRYDKNTPLLSFFLPEQTQKRYGNTCVRNLLLYIVNSSRNFVLS